jgi:hypothetical protein
MVYFWPLALANVAEGYISAKRIEEFLLASEKKRPALENDDIIDRKVDEKKSNKKDKLHDNGALKVSYSNQSITKRIVNLNATTKGIIIQNITAAWEAGDTQNAGIYDFN